MDDILIVQELHNKNIEAFTWMYEKYYKVLLAHADYLLKDDVEAEEAVQDVFCKLLDFKNWGQVKNLRSYLYKILHNYCLSKLTAEKRAHEKKMDFSRAMLSDTWEAPDLHDAKQADKKLQHLLSHLSPQRLRAFHLVYQEGLSYEAAADSLGISKNSIKTHIKLGLRVLRGFGPFLFIILFYLA